LKSVNCQMPKDYRNAAGKLTLERYSKQNRLIGILAVQGDFSRHAKIVRELGLQIRLVKTPGDLVGCDALILPGGESTTMTRLLKKYGLMKPLKEFALSRPVMGTCAGAIMLARNVDDKRVEPLGIMDITVERNAYGSQIESFVTELNVDVVGNYKPFRAVFIRAPQIHVESPAIQILAEYENIPVAVRQKKSLALAFHPELTGDRRIHRYFFEHVAGISIKSDNTIEEPAPTVVN
jgi:pyridoxal 5'-phosphate synthase pdxT subunit